jgi:nitric oxide reductase NorD protein
VARTALRHAVLRERLDCRFDAVDTVFDDCVDEALRVLTPAGMDAYIAHARLAGQAGSGRGAAAGLSGDLAHGGAARGRSRAGPAGAGHAGAAEVAQRPGHRVALHQSLGAVARRLRSKELLAQYLALVVDLMQRTSISIHGRHATEPSPSLPTFLQRAPQLVGQVPLDGLRTWVLEGLRLHGSHPQRQIDFFNLATPDSRALLQRQRHGTLLVDVERRLDLTALGLWGQALPLVPYPVLADDERSTHSVAMPYLQHDGLRLPEVLDNRPGATALQRYRAMLAHAAGHRRWSRPQVADNLSPLQRLAVETFEDARIDHLVLRASPAWRGVLRALHPVPAEDACDPVRESCLRHRLACLSRALLDPGSPYSNRTLLEFVALFHAELAGRESSAPPPWPAWRWSGPPSRAGRATSRRWCTSRTPRWTGATTTATCGPSSKPVTKKTPRPTPRHAARLTRVACHRATTPNGTPQRWPPRRLGQRLRHAAAQWRRGRHRRAAGAPQRRARHLKRLLDLLKPQDRTRLRHQEQGSELDLDVACARSATGAPVPSPTRAFHMSTRTDGRDIAVLLLVDLSQSVNDARAGQRRHRAVTQPRGGGAAGAGDCGAGRPAGDRRLSLQHPPRSALSAHQGLFRALG